MNVGTFLTRRALLSPDALGFIDGDRRLTFAEAEARAYSTAARLRVLGVTRGTAVAVLLQNSLEWVDVFFALARLGAIIVPLNWRLSAAEMAIVCEDAGARVLVHSADLPEAAPLAVRHRFDIDVIVDAPGWISGGPRDDEVETVGGDDDPLLIIYTSGTTGRPKGAVHTHRSWYWAAATVIASLDFRPGDRGLVVLPMFHVGGLIMTLAHVQSGASSILARSFQAEAMLRLLTEGQVDHLLCVPTMLVQMSQAPGFAGADLSGIRWCLAAAAPLAAALIRTYAAHGLRVQQSYGLTETGGPATLVPAHAAVSKAGSVGVPFFHTAVRVVDPAGQPAVPGAVGEVHVSGAHVIREYWRDPGSTAEAIHDDWFQTGDLARLDEDGYLWLVDRKHDMIISGGENVSPLEVEQALHAHPAVAEAAVFGLPDEIWGETVSAAIVLRRGAALDEAELLRYCRSRLAPYKLPRKVFFVAELPRNSTGKVLRRDLRQHLRT